ncbi:hypothetical protein COLO4_37523 [Corchorus olitorius]|uniref:Uncharacterized protein n=1 Tax=Corchorus olitorius TaxID=93759 RepID=A0A1R3G113_9ROSI|nr:hypothetical protein COLO4_37523 [Corchorus olitorius]
MEGQAKPTVEEANRKGNLCSVKPLFYQVAGSGFKNKGQGRLQGEEEKRSGDFSDQLTVIGGVARQRDSWWRWRRQLGF